MFRIATLLTKSRKIPPTPPVQPIKTLAVVEKKSIAGDIGLAVGGGIVKTGAIVGTVGLVGAGAEKFKNSLFQGLNNIGDSGLAGLGSGLSDVLGGVGDSVVNGVILIGGVVICGVIYKVLTKK